MTNDFVYVTRDLTEEDGRNVVKIALEEDERVIWLKLTRKGIDMKEGLPDYLLFFDKRENHNGKIALLDSGNNLKMLKNNYGVEFKE